MKESTSWSLSKATYATAPRNRVDKAVSRTGNERVAEVGQESDSGQAHGDRRKDKRDMLMARWKVAVKLKAVCTSIDT